MRYAGLSPRVDAACNALGRREGKLKGAPAICFGSHIDTVPHGGRFDGILGCLAAIECAHTLQDAGITTFHPLEAIVFANEEGQSYAALSGSKAMAGVLKPEELDRKDAGGRVFAEAIRDFGGDPEHIRKAARTADDLCAYLELHVEQGGRLEAEKIPIGVVEGIVGIVYHDIRVTGFANHAGTTPMHLRRDALVAASRFIVAVDQTIRTGNYCSVGTVGRIEVLPNSRNVVPGEVRLTLGLRDLQLDKVSRAVEALKRQADQIGQDSRVEFEFTPRESTEPAISDARVMSAIERAARDLNLAYKIMPSGAGHDAQMMARICPMGMIFVPSVGGVSHSDEEFTSIEDCANGANVLLRTILNIDSWRGGRPDAQDWRGGTGRQ
jgi:N-carbamoyl-L-amino-acid hydrolase